MAHRRTTAALLAASILASQCVPGGPARAQNQMGYKLLSAAEAAGLPRRGGTLGTETSAGQPISDQGLSFQLLRVNAVRRGSPAAQAGLNAGDLIIATDGLVFPTTGAFSAYVASLPPGRQVSIDYMPAGGGPAQAQRVAVTLGTAAGRAVAPAPQEQARTGLSTGSKLAIGAGAAALFGCYELGCFSRSGGAPAQAQQQPGNVQQPR